MSTRPPAIDGILETALYVADLARAARFYEDTLGLVRLFEDDRMVAIDAGRRSVLLLFRSGSTQDPVTTPDGIIPGHGGSGSIHVAFAVPAGSIETWRTTLSDAGVPPLELTRWPEGGESLYVRDPDGHLVELATPGLWPTY